MDQMFIIFMPFQMITESLILAVTSFTARQNQQQRFKYLIIVYEWKWTWTHFSFPQKQSEMQLCFSGWCEAFHMLHWLSSTVTHYMMKQATVMPDGHSCSWYPMSVELGHYQADIVQSELDLFQRTSNDFLSFPYTMEIYCRFGFCNVSQ